MSLEIDMLSVGNADAILIRTIDVSGQHIVVIDAGRKEHASDVIKHIRTHYDGNTTIDLLISTHPHDDHIGGITGILDASDIKVKKALIHDPRTFVNQIRAIQNYTKHQPFCEAMKSLTSLNTVIDKLNDCSIPHCQPFADQVYGLRDKATLTVVGPTEPFYADLAPNIKSLTGYEDLILAIKSAVLKEETRSDVAIVDEHDDTSAFNNSSVILLLTYKDSRYLFTADAGPKAFCSAIEYAKDCGSDNLLSDIYWMQIPHHGSKGNITSDLIKFFRP